MFNSTTKLILVSFLMTNVSLKSSDFLRNPNNSCCDKVWFVLAVFTGNERLLPNVVQVEPVVRARSVAAYMDPRQIRCLSIRYRSNRRYASPLPPITEKDESDIDSE